MSEQDISAEVEELRQQLARQAAEASAACQEWDARCQGLEAEAADLRERLTTTERLAQVRLERREALERRLVPEAGLLERAAVYATAHSLVSPGNIGRSQSPDDALQLRETAYAIRAWRGDGDGREEQEEGDKS